MSHVAVKFNRPSTHGLTHTDSLGAGYTEFNLRAGVNKVPKEIWDRHEKHPVIKAMIDEGILEVGSKKVAPEQYLASIKSTAEALDTVKKTIDTDLLNAWKKIERRVNIKKAIDKQLKDLAAPPEIRDRSKTEEEKAAAADGADSKSEELSPDFSNDGE